VTIDPIDPAASGQSAVMIGPQRDSEHWLCGNPRLTHTPALHSDPPACIKRSMSDRTRPASLFAHASACGLPSSGLLLRLISP